MFIPPAVRLSDGNSASDGTAVRSSRKMLYRSKAFFMTFSSNVVC